MLETLKEAERLLPKLLKIEEGWTGLYADSEKPHLMRLWRQWGENRIYLHYFKPCGPDEVFPHPHPWPFAVRILEGDYEMGLAVGADPAVPPPVFSRVMLKPGSAYEMTRPDGWHWVRPILHGWQEVSVSLMVAGPPIWPQNRIRANKPARGLTSDEALWMRKSFSHHYPG